MYHLGVGLRLPRSGPGLHRAAAPLGHLALPGREARGAAPARAATLRDQDERLRVFREFERLWIGEQAAVVPLVYNDRALWRRPWLTGMWVNAIAKSSFAEAVVRRP